MAKRTFSALTNDFSEVKTFLVGRGQLPKVVPQAILDSCRKIHACTYSLILWRFRLTLEPHAAAFVEELASDALQVLPQALLGFNKSATLLLRGVIENTLRHLYFADHPVEFARMNREEKWYLSMEELYEYPKIHPTLPSYLRRFDAINKLKTLYNDLSRGVHGRRVEDMEMRIALSKIQSDDASLKVHEENVVKCAEAANFVLAAFHLDSFRKWSAEERGIVLGTLPREARQCLAGVSR